MDDEDADDDEEDRFSSPRVLRASARHRRRSFKDPSSTSIGTDRSGQTTSEIDTRSRLTRSRYARYIRQNGEHARGLAMDDGNDEDHGLKIKKPSAEVARLDTSTDGSQSVAALAVPRKARQAQNTDRKVPNLPLGRRRLRARSTKVARMGIDDNGEVDDDEDEDEDGEAGDDDDEQEADGEEEDVEYDQYPKGDQDEECRFKQGLSSSKGSLQQQQQQEQEQQHSQQQNQQCVLSTSPSAQDTLALLDGFIASKPETPGTHVVTNSAAQNLTHFKRKVEEDEEMEDAPISADEGQLVSTKLARIDDSDGQERSAYMRSLYNILKSPRDDDDGILSSESEDADLESEDDEDDFEEIDVWEFIATLPPLGPLPPNFVSTMPDKTPDTPPITLESPDIIFPVEYNQETWEVYGRIRPGMLEFLEKMSAKFEVITFTASQECYAEALLKIIDPEKKYIKHRYYRDSCVPVFGNYVKDLRILNRDLAKVVIIDNSPQAFGYQLSNGIPIESWYEDKSDRELAKVMEFLETLNGVDDVRPKIDEHFRLSERIQKALAAANHHQNNSLSELEFGNRLPSTSMSSIDVCAGSDNSVALGATLASHVDAVTNTTSASDLLLSGGDMGMSDLHQQALAGLVDLDPRLLYTDGSLMQIDQEAISIEAPDETIAFAACASGLSISATSTTTTTINGMTTHTSDSAGNVTTMTIKTRSNSLEAAHNLARITL
ncbi:hypothetical protein BGW42_007631 [Actinomortierella wolfii]|nr:hypothetical protein BGW42_007631 [Actinomortierella wolfii]